MLAPLVEAPVLGRQAAGELDQEQPCTRLPEKTCAAMRAFQALVVKSLRSRLGLNGETCRVPIEWAGEETLYGRVKKINEYTAVSIPDYGCVRAS